MTARRRITAESAISTAANAASTPAFSGDCRRALLDLADDFDRRIAELVI